MILISIKSTKTSIKYRKKENAEIAAKKAAKEENVEMGSIHERTQNQLAADKNKCDREVPDEYEPQANDDEQDQNQSKPAGMF